MTTPTAIGQPIDALLREAIACHQAGRLERAEQLYRQILALRPGFAEVHVNLGIVLMFRGELDQAAAAAGRGIALKPDYAKGHNCLGDIMAHQGKLEEAEKSYRQTLLLKPDYAEAHNNLGNVLMQQGKMNEAAAAYRRAIDFKPAFVEAYNNLGNLLARQDRPDEAISCYRRALELRPGMAEAHNNIGHILLQREQFDEAAASFGRALAINPAYAEAHSNLGAALADLNQLDDAVASCRRAIAARPNYAEAHCNLGNVLKKQRNFSDAETCFRKAIAFKPEYAEAHKQLGLVLCEQNRIEDGFAALTHYAQLSYGPGKPLRPGPVVSHKIQHDREQRAYLTGAQTSDGEALDESLRLADGSRIDGPAVNLRNCVGEIERQWRESRPQIVVIDRLLTDEALGRLRRFCLGSTIWRVIYEGGYLGAMPEHGFGCPLLAQIAEELRAAYPGIFGGHPLRHSWAFKYDSRLSGIKLHADFAAVNVNFWITPDDANLDPESGGLVVWDAAAPLDWDFMKYNTAEKDIRGFLAREGAKPVTIPYRANRAVIFDSDLFHETDRIAFKEGYLNRRINVTLLYGDRDKDGNAGR